MQNPTEDTRSRVMPRTTRLEIYAVENNLRPYLALQKIRFFYPLRNVPCYYPYPRRSKVIKSANNTYLEARYVLGIVESFDTRNMGRDSAVGIANGYGLDGPGIESWWGSRYSTPVQTYPGVHPASSTMGTGSFPGVKRLGRGVDHPPHIEPRLKKE